VGGWGCPSSKLQKQSEKDHRKKFTHLNLEKGLPKTTVGQVRARRVILNTRKVLVKERGVVLIGKERTTKKEKKRKNEIKTWTKKKTKGE